MRNAVKNQIKIWYSLRNVISDEDEWGNTKNVATYGSPLELKINVSADKGEASAQAFGADLQYDREMVTYDKSCPINEYTRLWIDDDDITDKLVKTVWTEGSTIYINTNGVLVNATAEETTLVGTKPHNYEVVGVSKSLNCIRYAIRRVNVSR